jgi:hypothetical protein
LPLLKQINKKVMNASFQHTDVENLNTESHWDVAIAVDLIQPN